MTPARDAEPRLRHLLTLEGLPRDTLWSLLDAAQAFADAPRDHAGHRDRLRARTVVNLFFEPSTRTRTSFEIAARRLGADVINFDAGLSSTRKGETVADTLRTIEAMGVDLFVVRHAEDGTLAALAEVARGARLVNAGEGRSAHPTQGLLDMLTIRQLKGGDFGALTVAILGDVRHSRVARSDLHALRTLGTGEVRVCGPQSLLPEPHELAGCTVFDRADDAVRDADVVITLRVQRERMESGLVGDVDAFHRDYGLTRARFALAAEDAIVMHPGPMNRGVEIADALADGPRSAILRQVANGVHMRMAVLERLLAPDH